jgi:hypothetical protein
MTKHQKCFGSPKKLKRKGGLPKSPTHNNNHQSEKENPQTSSQGWGELVAKIG